MPHIKGIQATIRLYGFVEMDLGILPEADDQEIENILANECRQVVDEMKSDFWDKFKKLRHGK